MSEVRREYYVHAMQARPGGERPDPMEPTTWLEHLRARCGSTPEVGAGTALDALPLLTWETLDQVLASPLSPDVMTVAGGRLVRVAPPSCTTEVRALMRRGVSVVVRASERHDARLEALAAGFRRMLPGQVHVQLYATPAGTNSYGWHYDFEDVFIAQTAGMKDYFFRRNTLGLHTRLGEDLDFGVFRRETHPLYSSRLQPGDWLFLPARWWHLVRCVEDALSISVGVMSPEVVRRAVRVPPDWGGQG